MYDALCGRTYVDAERCSVVSISEFSISIVMKKITFDEITFDCFFKPQVDVFIE